MASMWVDPARVREFVDFQSFYDWLAQHHATADEIWIRLYKKGSGHPSISAREAVDAELCWGWVDGIRKGLDATSFLQRYTPRRRNSVWSRINRDNVERLTAAGLMRPAGQAEVDRAKADGRWAAAYSVSESEPPEALVAAIRADPEAAAFYSRLTAQNRFALTFRVLALKTEAGRSRAVARFVEMLRRGETIYPQARK
ncbi:MAG: YdeI/OmpD-associated family protein [Devosia sp.]|nr:YdeI/OmpD-associated family protein [Devosia sp.]